MRLGVAVVWTLFVTGLKIAVEVQWLGTSGPVNLAGEAVQVRAAVVSVSVDAVIFTGHSY